MTLQETLKQLVAGKNYPSYVKVTEPDGMVIEFHCNSFYVGMYCAIHVNGSVASQTGDYNNKKCVAKLKKDLVKAEKRGAKVELDISDIRDCKLTMD